MEQHGLVCSPCVGFEKSFSAASKICVQMIASLDYVNELVSSCRVARFFDAGHARFRGFLAEQPRQRVHGVEKAHLECQNFCHRGDLPTAMMPNNPPTKLGSRRAFGLTLHVSSVSFLDLGRLWPRMEPPGQGK